MRQFPQATQHQSNTAVSVVGRWWAGVGKQHPQGCTDDDDEHTNHVVMTTCMAMHMAKCICVLMSVVVAVG
jgi:hypothetical protein